MKRLLFLMSMLNTIIIVAYSARVDVTPPYWSYYDGEPRLVIGFSPQDLQYHYLGADSTRLVVLDRPYGAEVDCECPLYSSEGESILTVPSHINVLDVDADVVALGERCFEYSDFNKIILPETLQFIGFRSFRKTSLSEIEFGNNVQIIDDWSFNENKLLESITLPDNLWSIGTFCFVGNGFKEVNFGKSLYLIGNESFSDNHNLEQITLPLGLYKIGRECFNNCANLSKVTILSHIEIHDCFNDCPNIKQLELMMDNPYFISNCFNNVNKDECQLIVPKSALDKYKSHSFWKQFKNIIAADEYTSETMCVSNFPLKDQDLRYYNLDGTPNSQVESYFKGVVIEVSNGKTKKIIK